jgi:ABC-type cobalamin/Fe3+-siderophores transport system ATPase subunit
LSYLLEVEGVGFSYGGRSVLHSATFSAGEGEFLALLGMNGAGKSTLLDIISGFRRPETGSVTIAGRKQQLWTLHEMSQQVSHLPQSIHADLPFTAEQLVAMGRYPHTDRWFESDEDHRLIQQAMQRTRCWPLRHRVFGTLSGGERQRVLLAACLAQNASTLLLDEPSTFLDIEHQLHCFTLLQDEARAGKLCVAVTHDLNLALTYCTRLIVLAEGVVAHDIPTSEAQNQKEDRKDWLALFSPRLNLSNTPAGTPWVWYQ